MKYIYAGSSWAASSFPVDSNATNLAREWNLPYINTFGLGSTLLGNIDLIKKIKTRHPIVWIYHDPIIDFETITGLSSQEFFQRADYHELREECNQYCLNAINSLGVPVLLIGGASDVVNCNFSNIVVGCKSWQKWLVDLAGLNSNLDHYWSAEIVHLEICKYPDLDPCPGLVDEIYEHFQLWKQLEQQDLFYEVHPNKRANQEFAKFLLPTVTEFLKDT